MKIFKKNFWIIFALGMSSGLPLALVLSTLKALLADQNFDLRIIGFMSLVTIPYSIKFLFAPFIDSLKIPILSKIFKKRRSWIFLTQILLVFSILLLGIAGQRADLGLIVLFAFLVATFSAMQDVTIDGYRIELFEPEDQGLGASFQIFGYRIGMLISGAFALFLADHYDWQFVYLIMSIFMAFCCFATFFAKERDNVERKKGFGFLFWVKEFVIAPIKDFAKRSKWYIILLFVIFFKLSDAFAGSLAIPFFLELGFSKSEIATIVKTFGLFATLLGVFCGGVIVKKLGIYKSLFLGVIIQALSNLTYAYLSGAGYNINALYATIFVENFSGGIGDAVFVAYLSMLCNIRFSATQYAILSSFAGLSRILFASGAGVVALKIGWYKFFIFSIFLSIPTLIFLLIIKKYMRQ